MKSNLKILRFLKLRNIREYFEYQRWCKFIEESQWWGIDEYDRYQWEKLKSILNYSYANIPYYRELFIKMGAVPEDIKSINDFRNIPFLTRNIVRERAADLVSTKVRNKSRLKSHKTSGTTGEPMQFYRLRGSHLIEDAFMFHQWKRVGFSKNSSRMILRGELLKDSQLFQRLRFTNDWLFSSYHLTGKYLNEYVKLLNKLKPDFFHVYPSSLYIFTHLLLDSKLKLDFAPKAILSGSEKLYDHQRRLFEKVYQTRVYSWLGLTEGTTLAGECEHSESLHVWPQHSYVELIDKNGLAVKDMRCSGSIIGTTLNNIETPFIRYISGDMAVYGGNECNLCGRKHMLFERIEGREQHIVILSDGSAIPFNAFDNYFSTEINAWKKIRKMQYIQTAKGVIVLKIYAADDFNYNDNEEIRTKLGNFYGDLISIKIEHTDTLFRSSTGKSLDFIQRVNF